MKNMYRITWLKLSVAIQVRGVHSSLESRFENVLGLPSSALPWDQECSKDSLRETLLAALIVMMVG